MDDPTPATQVVPESFVAAMRLETDHLLRQVMEAVNRAPDGAWINGSEGQVRDLLGEYRRRVYEVALQMKADVAKGAFPPVDPATGQCLSAKGPAPRSTLTSNGRISVTRSRWAAPGGGGLTPIDALLDEAEATISRGARELCCRVGIESKSFGRAARHLKQVGQLSISTTLLGEVVEEEGKRALAAAESGALEPGWKAADCKVRTPEGAEMSRVYVGVDAGAGEGPGKRWDADNAEAVIGLEALQQSQLWERYWATCAGHSG